MKYKHGPIYFINANFKKDYVVFFFTLTDLIINRKKILTELGTVLWPYRRYLQLKFMVCPSSLVESLKFSLVKGSDFNIFSCSVYFFLFCSYQNYSSVCWNKRVIWVMERGSILFYWTAWQLERTSKQALPLKFLLKNHIKSFFCIYNSIVWLAFLTCTCHLPFGT